MTRHGPDVGAVERARPHLVEDVEIEACTPRWLERHAALKLMVKQHVVELVRMARLERVGRLRVDRLEQDDHLEVRALDVRADLFLHALG
eukprot:CAMPEP_0119431660 /NCGR_PEP_ID=MMETSP1335-20130426/46357_1 /TAXON_ID=259385 /ORGANISM="Chrysoculter rhomboideus, Strain RCC1486" /LENGTH=89 /DNA_ID=CAMNT_0007457467 /DNA_START=88 /DNA_END=353 /DNA_ORIENTATION=+